MSWQLHFTTPARVELGAWWLAWSLHACNGGWPQLCQRSAALHTLTILSCLRPGRARNSSPSLVALMPTHTPLASLQPPQRELLAQLCEQVPGVPEKDALRFLVARNFELPKAAPFLQADLAWRKSYAPSEVTQSSLPRVLPSGVWRSLGVMQVDGVSVAFLWVQLSLFWPEQYDVAEFLSLLVYFLERLGQVREL